MQETKIENDIGDPVIVINPVIIHSIEKSEDPQV